MDLNQHLQQAEQKAAGRFRVGTNPVIEAIAKHHEAQHSLRAAQGLAQLDDQAAFTAAAKQFLGCKVPRDLRVRQKLCKIAHVRAIHAGPVPTSLDLRAQGKVPPVKNQANCGSCWCFSGYATAEGANLNAGRALPTGGYAEEDCLNCGQNGGCDGDWPETALQYLQNHGTSTTQQVPYTASSGSGQCGPSPQKIIDAYGYLETNGSSQVATVQDIQEALNTGVTVSCAVIVDNAWAAYRGGIFQNTAAQDPNQINHAIDLVGYVDDSSVPGGGYWILRNHWGTGWGENGYMRTAYGANMVGFGAIQAHVNAPAPGPSPVPPSPPSPPTPPGPVAPLYTGVVNYNYVAGQLVSVTTGTAVKITLPSWLTSINWAQIEAIISVVGVDGLPLVVQMITAIQSGNLADYAAAVAALNKLITDLKGGSVTAEAGRRHSDDCNCGGKK